MRQTEIAHFYNYTTRANKSSNCEVTKYITYCSETYYEMFIPACGRAAAAAIVMCARGFWPVLSLLQVVSEIQISFIQAHWHEMRIIVSKNLTNLTETSKLISITFHKRRKMNIVLIACVCLVLTSSLTALYLSELSGTIMRPGQSFFAIKPGMAARTPNLRAW